MHKHARVQRITHCSHGKCSRLGTLSEPVDTTMPALAQAMEIKDNSHFLKLGLKCNSFKK